MSTTPPRQRRRDRVADVYSPGAASDNDAPGTPGPTRARINNLEGQVQELVRKLHAVEVSMDVSTADMQRKAAAEAKEHQHKMEEVNNKEAWARFQLEDATAKLTRMEQKVSGFAVNMDIERTMVRGLWQCG